MNYVDIDFSFFNNFSGSFNDFLNDKILSKDIIDEIEIISPYFSKDYALLNWLHSKNIKNIKCLIPTLRNDEVQLEKEHFIQLQNLGFNWCDWSNPDFSKEVRNQHAKIYRLYSKKNVYTFIGSVNFTNPAWNSYDSKNNTSNIECGILYIENNKKTNLLKTRDSINVDEITFISGRLELENPTSESLFNRNAPDIEFRIDWKNRVLDISANLKKLNCTFFEQFDNEKIKNGKSKININPIDYKRLSKNSIIKVEVEINFNKTVYCYYANQDFIEAKPLGFKLDAYTILEYWQFFNDDYAKDKITKLIAEKTTDESGIIDSNRIETKLLLNEMATHFNGLIRLEKFLYPQKNLNQAELKEQFSNLQYYLLSENIDTLSFYMNEISEQFEQELIQSSFYWMVLQIIDNMMFFKAEKCLAKKIVDDKTWKLFITDIKMKRQEIAKISSDLTNKIPDLKLKEKWVVSQLLTEYN